jgi:hypothetical protein
MKALGRPTRRWNVNIKLALKKQGKRVWAEWIHVDQDGDQWPASVRVA